MYNSTSPNLFSRRDFIKGGVLCGAAVCAGLGKFSLAATGDNSSALSAEPQLSFIKKMKRDAESYTQGLAYEIDEKSKRPVLYESGGQYRSSLLRRVDAETLEPIQQIKIADQYFAEGLAIVDDRIFMLTWQEHACFVYEKDTLKRVDEFRYRGEGWGLAYDGKYLAMSDGSSKIRFMDPSDFRQKKSIDVHFTTKNGVRKPVKNLNELEYVNGELWANVFQQKYVVRIDPETGEILGNALNFANLVPENLKNSRDFVLNGLAYDAAGKRLFLTGKRWPVMYVLGVNSSSSERPAAVDA